MTVTELAKKMNTSVLEIFERYEKLSEYLPQDVTYVLNTELIHKLIPDYQPTERSDNVETIKGDKPKLITNRLEDLTSKPDDRRTKRIEILDNLEPYFKKSDYTLLKEFKTHNSISNFIFEGLYRKVPSKDFGFFKNITHQDGNVLTYPISHDSVGEIFIATGSLSDSTRYLFEATIASKYERINKSNPFLLQAKNENIQEIKEFSALSQELRIKQERLEEINTYLEKAEDDFERTKGEIEERIRNVSLEKQMEANKTIEEYNQKIKSSFIEIKAKEKEILTLQETVEETNKNLSKMEDLISTLKERVSLCKNLQFISDNDEDKYLNLLSPKEFKPTNHLDFRNDFEKSFSKLSEHIHAYLFHKKHLIYTRYQIRNFLILLKTHDIIVLSGLSGSGKTQIVKAFAEALGGVAKIIPVKPNWTSSEDLIGYYNPLQMSFLPTPFTEAIVEAINNPNQLYFICLDEMNLARAEYYFADFLSKLEERSKQPEIELYANHEEELFVSEFSTLLNLIESSIKGKQIKSWQEFLDDEEARKRFFEMLGNTDKESMLQLHAKMKRRLIDILKFPSTIKIPDNVRFIGAINVDETTHYFSPKILDRIHVVKFDNPLLFEEQVTDLFKNVEYKKELLPVYLKPSQFSERIDYPKLGIKGSENVTSKLKELNKKFLHLLNIDFGIRSIRQSVNYSIILPSSFPSIMDDVDIENISESPDFDSEQKYLDNISLNSVIIQKIFPRFIFDGNDIAKNGEVKIKIVEDLRLYLFENFEYEGQPDEGNVGKTSNEYLTEMLTQARRNNSQFNFFA